MTHPALETALPLPSPLDPPVAAAATFVDEVVVQAVRWSSADGSFVILTAACGDREIPMVGALAHLREGDRAQVSGYWTEHERFGVQVEVSSAVPLDPTDGPTQRKYLGELEGFGKKTVDALIDAHGPGTFEALDRDAEATLAALEHTTQAKAELLAETWNAKRDQRDLYMLLAPFDLARLVSPLVERLGSRACDLISENPYALTSDTLLGLHSATSYGRWAHPVPFPVVDRLGAHLGFGPTDPQRTQAAMGHAVREAEGRGHTFASIAEVMKAAVRAGCRPELSHLWAACRHDLKCVDDRVWRARTFYAERDIARREAALRDSPAVHQVDVPERPPEIHADLSDEQWSAVRSAFDVGFSLIVGGPGTGKTSLVRAICEIGHRAGVEIALCAPTGRAARRLEQATGHPATTIHRLLEWGHRDEDEDGGDAFDGPRRRADRPLECEMLLVDEASMIDTTMAAYLLNATPNGCRVVFIGDRKQLQSVGPGQVLADLTDSATVHVTHLTRIFRQAQRSMIVVGAHAIDRGELPDFSTPPGGDGDRDLFFVQESDPDRLVATVAELTADRLPRHFNVDPLGDVLVLAPSHRGPAGVAALNSTLQERLNPYGRPLWRLPHLRVGDKVLWTQNDPDLELMNGMTLVIQHDHTGGEQVIATDEDGVDRFIPYAKAKHLVPAFAMTTHKAQGTEVPVVVVVLHRRETHPNLLSRPLLYTALTRAKQVAVFAGEVEALQDGVARATADGRNTALLSALRNGGRMGEMTL